MAKKTQNERVEEILHRMAERMDPTHMFEGFGFISPEMRPRFAMGASLDLQFVCDDQGWHWKPAGILGHRDETEFVRACAELAFGLRHFRRLPWRYAWVTQYRQDRAYRRGPVKSLPRIEVQDGDKLETHRLGLTRLFWQDASFHLLDPAHLSSIM